MIGFLSGLVEDTIGDSLILLVGDVGYAVTTPKNLQVTLKQKLSLYIHTHVREDEISLFGFPTKEDLSFFHNLVSVSGVGPKLALTILGQAKTEAIKNAINTSNLTFFTNLPGIGKKTAQRLIIELKPKLGKGEVDLSKLENNQELTDALKNLGFSNQEIAGLVTIDSSQPLEIQLKAALKELRK